MLLVPKAVFESRGSFKVSTHSSRSHRSTNSKKVFSFSLLGLVSVFSSVYSHSFLVNHIVVNLLFCQFLVLVLDIVDKWLGGVTCKRSEVVMVFRDESNTHPVDGVLSSKGPSVWGEISFHWRILATPLEDGVHVWIKMPEVLLQSVLSFIVSLWSSSLMTCLCLPYIRLRSIPWPNLGILFPMEHSVDLIGLFVPLSKLVSYLLSVVHIN